MGQLPPAERPRLILSVLNNIYEMETKIKRHGDAANLSRNLERIKDAFAAEDVFYEDPLGQIYKETRSDLEASISGTSTENLIVTEVIKPIIRAGPAHFSRVVQKGVVVVESKGQAGGQNV